MRLPVKGHYFAVYKRSYFIFKNDPDVKAKTEEYIDNFATPYQAAMRGMVDLVIEPQNTRPTVINALQMLQSKRETRPAKRHGNIPL